MYNYVNGSNNNIDNDNVVLKGDNKLSVNGNNLYYTMASTDFDPEIVFKNNPDIDSLIVLEKRKDNTYKMFVHERDGSISDYCGNASIGALQFLGKGKIYFDVDGKKLEVKEENNKIFSQFYIETNLDNLEKVGIIEDRDLFEKLKNNLTGEIFRILEFYEKNYIEIYKIFENNKKIASYISHLISYIDKKDFKDFVSDLEVKGLVTSNNEPHLVIETAEELDNTKFDVYQKLLSFLVMYSFEEGKRIFPKSVNVMFVSPSGKIYSCERGILNGIDYCKTGACGTGTSAVAYLLGEKDYKSRSGFLLETKKDGETIYFIVSKENISKIKNKSKKNKKEEIEPFYGKVFVEQLNYVLSFFGKKSIKELTEELIKEIGIEELIKIKKELGIFVFNSGWHENEFPIDPYKIITYANQVTISKYNYIPMVLLYLDTMRTKEKNLKRYPNINIEKGPKILKKILDYLKESDSFEEFKNKFKIDYKKIFFTNDKAKVEFKRILKNRINLEEKEAELLIKLLLHGYNLDKIALGFYKFFLINIKNNWKKLKLNPLKREKLIFKWFQDYFISFYVKDFYPDLASKLYNDKIKLFSESRFFKDIISAILILYSSEKLKKLLEKYFKKIIEKKGGEKIQIGITIDKSPIFVDNEFGKIVYFKGEKKVEGDILSFFEKNIEVFNGNIMLFVLYITGQIQLGSERGYRQIFIEVIKDDPAFSNFVKYLELSYLAGNYNPGEKIPRKIPAGTDNTITQDIFLSVLLGSEFSNKELKLFLEDYLSTPNLEKEEILRLILSGYEGEIKNIIDYMFSEIQTKNNYKISLLADQLGNNLNEVEKEIKKIDQQISGLEEEIKKLEELLKGRINKGSLNLFLRKKNLF